MKRAKKPKKKPVTMTTTQIEKLKDEVRRDVLDKMCLLILAATSDTVIEKGTGVKLKGWS